MQINKLQINNYGKLKNKDIELEEGINVICGKNESGKSTLLNFIISMLYGISRTKNGKRISDYEKYTPWDEGEFSGTIKYELDNSEIYEVYRHFGKKSTQIVDKFGNDVSKDYTIDKTYGNRFYTEQTKVDEELFRTSMVIMQQEVKLDEKKQNSLIQKASNIMLTGEDDVSYKAIITKLSKKQTDEIGTEKSPTKPLYLTKQKIENLKRRKEEINSILPFQYEIEDKKVNVEKEALQAEKELELLQEIQKMQNEFKLEEEKINVNKKSKEETQKKKQEEENNLRNVKTEIIELKSYKMLYIIPILLTILSIITFIMGQNIVPLVGIIIAIIGFIRITLKQSKETKKFISKNEEERQKKESIKNKIDLLENEIKEKDKIIKEKQNELETKLNINKTNLKTKFQDINNIEALTRKAVASDSILEEQRHINNLKLEISKLEMQRKEILDKLEDTSKVEEELENAKENLEELISYNNSIEVAKQEIEKAYIQMKENITPKFLSNLSNAIKNISNNKYKTVKVNDEEGLMVETENGHYVPADMLSIGTIDQLYLSLRISSINELTKENMPIILDETFAYFDDERLENVLRFLSEEYKDKQIVILTCTERENKILERIGIKHNKISL